MIWVTSHLPPHTTIIPSCLSRSLLVHLSQMRSTDVFQTILHSSSFVTLRSDYFQTHLVHSDMHDCFETSIRLFASFTIHPSIIHSCVVQQEKYIEIVFNKTSDYKSSPIYISCDEGKKTTLYPLK